MRSQSLARNVIRRLKHKPTEEMAIAIRVVNRGYAQPSPEIALKLFPQIGSVNYESIKEIDTLSPKKLEVLQLADRVKKKTSNRSRFKVKTEVVKSRHYP